MSQKIDLHHSIFLTCKNLAKKVVPTWHVEGEIGPFSLDIVHSKYDLKIYCITKPLYNYCTILHRNNNNLLDKNNKK